MFLLMGLSVRGGYIMLDLDPVLMSRLLTGLTLAFHIIFATLGVGVPLMISIAEFIGIRKKDPHYLLLARRWARGFIITLAIGVVTGTAIGLQLSLLWPNFMQLAGKDRKSTRLNSSHVAISYAVFCL